MPALPVRADYVAAVLDLLQGRAGAAAAEGAAGGGGRWFRRRLAGAEGLNSSLKLTIGLDAELCMIPSKRVYSAFFSFCFYVFVYFLLRSVFYTTFLSRTHLTKAC